MINLRFTPAMERLHAEAKKRGIGTLLELDDLADEMFGGYEMLTDDIQAVWRALAPEWRAA